MSLWLIRKGSFSRWCLVVTCIVSTVYDKKTTTRSTSQGKGAKPKSPTYGFDWFGDVTKSTNVVLARWFHFFDAKPKNVHFWCPKQGSRYRPLEWLIQLTSIFFRVPPNLSVKLPRDCSDVTHHRCCTGKSDYNLEEQKRTQNYILLFLRSPT